MPRFSLLSRVLCLAFAAVLAMSTPAAAQYTRGESAFGVRTGFVSRNTSAMAGLSFTYSFSSHVRIAPTADVYFRHNNLDALAVAVDVHFPVTLDTTGKAAFYPLAGVAYTSWGRHGVDESTQKDVSSHTNCLGLDLGAGIELRASDTMRLSLEARYTLMEHLPTAIVAVGIGYVF